MDDTSTPNEVLLAYRRQWETEVGDIIESLIDPEPCRFDHNHSCQEHYYFYLDPDEQCPMQKAKAFLHQIGR